ncbi:BgtA-20400 [Blumeria graminis f. sp. tritici]|uniref:Large ribosomal subunit protein mL54 n=3 Tax=Blumeria graminis TaxID=34373 RepID=A0A9X9MMN8_BLUGR|nr:hypothetical protein BGT96224_A20400 [Blumeria graminis f. sp. tritici 96224]VDB93522.1 BgtA-20400 [Blumeria graminis f. sp. tritici]
MSRLYRALVSQASWRQTQALPASLRRGPIAAFSKSSSSSYPSESSSSGESPALPVSSSPAGTVLRGLNYIQGHNDPIALAESHYPAWLWSLLDEKKASESADADEDSDLFAKSKKLRRKAAKRSRKLEAMRLASGQVLEVKVPLTQQSIDLPANEEGTLEGAQKAEESRKELKMAMRSERRKMIKQKNYLKSV